MNPPDAETIELLPAAGLPRQLFVLLHDAGGTGTDMLALGEVLGDAFAQAVVVIPEGLAGTTPGLEELAGLEEGRIYLPETSPEDPPAGLPGRVETLAAFLRAQQQRFGLLQSDSALLGFGAGASLALALSAAHDGLVGRVLAFGGTHAAWPAGAPLLTTLHLLHGQRDLVVPVRRVREAYGLLMKLSADATLDVASSVGHELHPALMEQAVTRLQTCVPLRFWKAL